MNFVKMTTRRTAKNNGYKLQKDFAKLVRDKFNLEERDVVSTPSSIQGEDILLTNKARKLFPYSVECKYREKMLIYQFWEQCKANSDEYEPLLVLKSKRKPMLICVDAEHYLKLLGDKNE